LPWTLRETIKIGSVFAIFALTILLGCSGGGGDGGGGDDDSNDNIVTETIIGPSGGTINNYDVNSPTYKVRIEIPRGALDENEVITMYSSTPPAEIPQENNQVSKCVALKPEGMTFNKEILITLPYNDKNNDGVLDGTEILEEYVYSLYYDELLERWLYGNVISVDTINNTVTIESTHFSDWILVILEGNGRDDVQIFTIDGLDFKKLFINAGLKKLQGIIPLALNSMRPSYLKQALVFGMRDLNLNLDNVYSYGGGTEQSWSGDAENTKHELPRLIAELGSEYYKAKHPNKSPHPFFHEQHNYTLVKIMS